MKIRAPALAAVLSAVLVSPALEAQERQLRPGYVLCVAGTQLTFFIEPSVMDLYNQEFADSVRVHPDGHPEKTASMDVGGRFVTVTQGEKAFELGDCRPTAGLENSSVEVVEDCTEAVPLPNGGCRRVKVSGSDKSWYTYADAIEDPEDG